MILLVKLIEYLIKNSNISGLGNVRTTDSFLYFEYKWRNSSVCYKLQIIVGYLVLWTPSFIGNNKILTV